MYSSRIVRSRNLITPVTLKSVENLNLPKSYTKQNKNSMKDTPSVIDSLIDLQSSGQLPKNVLVRRDGGKKYNDGIKSDVRRELRKVLRKM